MPALEQGKRYSFQTYAPGILGEFKNVLILGTVSFKVANREEDLYAMHARVYPMLDPKVVPDDPTMYSYVLVESNDGATKTLGLPYINPNTIEEVSHQYISVRVGGAVTAADIPRIRAALASNGYTETEITISG